MWSQTWQKKQIVPRLPECHHRSLGGERQPSARGVHRSPCPCHCSSSRSQNLTRQPLPNCNGGVPKWLLLLLLLRKGSVVLALRGPRTSEQSTKLNRSSVSLASQLHRSAASPATIMRLCQCAFGVGGVCCERSKPVAAEGRCSNTPW